MWANLAHIFTIDSGQIIRAIMARISNFGSTWSEVPGTKMWTNLVHISTSVHHGRQFRMRKHGPSWSRFLTSAQLGQKFPAQKRWPSWSQLTSVQLEQKLIIKTVPNLGTVLKARVRWEMVINLDTINFRTSCPEVGRKRSIEKGDQLGHLFLLQDKLSWSWSPFTSSQFGMKSHRCNLWSTWAQVNSVQVELN